MNKYLAVVLAMVMGGFLISSAIAGSNTSDQGNGQGVAQSNVSQTQIETQTKREEARKQRDKKLKIRGKNVQNGTNSGNRLQVPSK